MRRTALPALSVLALTAALATGCAGSVNSDTVTDGKAPWEKSESGASQTATGGTSTAGTSSEAKALAGGDIVDPTGKKIGAVSISKAEQGLSVQVTATGMTAGFHGLHVHSVGKCEPKSADPKDPTKTGDFLSSGGHLAGGGADHPDHAGDLPALYVGHDGSGSLTAVTDRLTEAQVGQEGGISLIVHAGPDNYANIPTRYAPNGPDAETKKAGDSGARIGCAVLKKS